MMVGATNSKASAIIWAFVNEIWMKEEEEMD